MARVSVLIIFLLTLTLVPISALAEPDCHCDQYKDLVGFSTLASQVADVGIAALHPEGRAFALSSEEATALRVKIAASKLIPDECKKKLILKTFQKGAFAARGVFPNNNTPSYSLANTNAVSDFEFYDAYYNSLLTYAWATSCQPWSNQSSSKYASCAVPLAKETFTNLQTFFNQPAQAILNQLTANGISNISLSDVQIAQAYDHMIAAGSKSALLAYAANNPDGLTNDQFMLAVSVFGYRLAQDYNHALAKSSTLKTSPVTSDQLLQAAQNDTMIGNPFYSSMYKMPDVATPLFETAGECSDIMTLMGKLLKARGFPNTYTISYAVAETYHTALVTQDPTRPRQIYQLDYSDTIPIKDQDGSIALFQNSVPTLSDPDTSISYRLNNPFGGAVANIPSEMGKFLAEADGFDIRTLDPVARTTSSMLGGGINVGSKGNGEIRIVTGQDGLGARYLLAAGNYSYGENTIAPGKIGILIGDQYRPASVYQTTDNENMAIGYLQAEQHFLTRPLHLSHGLSLTWDNSVTGIGLLSVMVNGADQGAGKLTGMTNSQGDLRASSELRLEHTSKGNRLRGVYRIGALGDLGFADPRVDIELPTIIPGGYAAVSESLRVSNITLIADAIAAVDELGSRGRAEAGLATDRISATGFISGRLTNNTAFYEDSTIRRVGMSLNYRPTDHLQLGLTGEIPIEGDSTLAEAYLMGSALVSF